MMNRPENALYNFDQNAATTAHSNESTEGDFAGPIQKLAIGMTNPMDATTNNIQAVNIHSARMAATTIRQPATSKSKGPATKILASASTLQADLPMPKRNLSSYNLFFQVERENIINGEEGMNYTHENIARVALRHYRQGKMELPRRKHRKTHGKISFAELARSVANRWKQLDPSIKEMFIHRTNIEKARYQTEIAEWADRKLRSKPPSPKRDAQPEPFALVDIFRPNAKTGADDGAAGTHRPTGHGDAIIQPEYIMPLRVFPPSTTSCVEHSLPATHGVVDSATVDFNNVRYVDTYSQFNSGMGIADSNNHYDFNQRYLSTAPNDFAAQMQQYPQLNTQPLSNSIAMSLQQQFDAMTERHGITVPQGQSPVQVYQPSFSMRSPSTIHDQLPTQRGDSFTFMPNENYLPNETFQQNIQYQAAFGTLSNRGGMYTTGQAQMRHETKLDDNETLDLQSLFNRFDAN